MADLKSKLTVVDTVYHRCVGQEPTSAESRFSRDLESDEQPYQRRLKVDEVGQPLDCGWVEEASQILIINEEGRNLQVNPTDQEREELRRKMLEVYLHEAFLKDCWLVPPGESMRGCPSSLQRLRVRSQSGVIRFTINIIPK